MYLVRALGNEGVDRVFGIPGEENLDVIESLRTSSIELVLTRHEQAAAFMAATCGGLTGRAGVCISTLGPGAYHPHRPEGHPPFPDDRRPQHAGRTPNSETNRLANARP